MTDTASFDPLQDTLPTMRKLVLKKYEVDNSLFKQYSYPQEPKTPSEWFSKHFPEQAKIYGCPFIELKESSLHGLDSIAPLALNVDFLAACLGGDKRLGHKVVYIESEMAFYYHDPADHLYKAVSEDKLGNLIRALMIRCAEELGHDVHKWKLFTEFRSDKTIRSIIHRAKSILAADDTFFSVESDNRRKEGPELYERVARAFVQQILERQAGETLLLTDAYVHFCEYLKSKNMPSVSRSQFKGLVPAAIQEQYEVGLRHDVVDSADQKAHYGWKDLRILTLQPDSQTN